MSTPASIEIRTNRLLLRRWRPEDRLPMEGINRDPEVGRYLNRPVDEAAVEGFHQLMLDHWATHGFGPWAVQSTEPESAGRFLGFSGLAYVPPFLAAAGTAPELGWRLLPKVWGRGLATEAAAAARDDAFDRLRVDELISIIHPLNHRSQRVAIKLGMLKTSQILNPLLGIDVDVWKQAHDR
jgi:RimJ/RimL family protein N-acetyltransferase